jgi:hypothetical protein
MLFAVSVLPYAIEYYLNERSIKVSDRYASRPDRLIEDELEEDLRLECYCNEANNVSALSFRSGQFYDIGTRSVMKTFLEV